MKRPTKIQLAVTLLIALLIGIATTAAAGPIEWNLTGGRYNDLSGTDQPYFVGGGARMGAGRFALVPNVEWLFVDDVQVYTLNVDATLVVVPAGAASVWVGGGLGQRTVRPDGGDSVKDRTTSLLIGAGTSLPMKPFGQVKWLLDDGDETPVAVSFGIRF